MTTETVILQETFDDFFLWRITATVVAVIKAVSRARLFVTPWTVPHQVPLSMEFSRQDRGAGTLLPSAQRFVWVLLNCGVGEDS